MGSNAHGQLGHGDLAPRGFFECIAPIRGKGVDKVYAGSDYAMMLTEDHEVSGANASPAARRCAGVLKLAVLGAAGLRVGRRRVRRVRAFVRRHAVTRRACGTRRANTDTAPSGARRPRRRCRPRGSAGAARDA